MITISGIPTTMSLKPSPDQWQQRGLSSRHRTPWPNRVVVGVRRARVNRRV